MGVPATTFIVDGPVNKRNDNDHQCNRIESYGAIMITAAIIMAQTQLTQAAVVERGGRRDSIDFSGR